MMDTLWPQIRLISVDFPQEGLPMSPTKAAFTRLYCTSPGRKRGTEYLMARNQEITGLCLPALVFA
jgi:hypothetical protein